MIDLYLSDGTNGPLCVMVPELLMPVVEGLRSKEFAWFSNRAIWQSPVSPEGKMDTI